jgi:hypothetical protein
MYCYEITQIPVIDHLIKVGSERQISLHRNRLIRIVKMKVKNTHGSLEPRKKFLKNNVTKPSLF